MTEHPFVYWGTLKLTPHEFHQLAAAAALSPEAEETAAEPESWTPGFQDCEGQAGAFANLSALRYIEIIIKVYKFYTFYKLYKLHISSISYMSFMSYRSGRHSSLEDFLVVQYHLLRSHHMSPCKNRNRPGTGRRDDPQLMVKYSMRPCACAHRYLRTYLSTISLISLRFFLVLFPGHTTHQFSFIWMSPTCTLLARQLIVEHPRRRSEFCWSFIHPHEKTMLRVMTILLDLFRKLESKEIHILNH